MNSAAKKALEALDAAIKRATPGPLAQWPQCKDEVFAVIGGDKETIAVFEHPDIDDEDDDENDFGRAVAHANAAAHVAAVNLAAPLAAVARAAMERPWWRGGFEDADGMEIARCDGCDAPSDAPGEAGQHKSFCKLTALDAALDALEAAAREATP